MIGFAHLPHQSVRPGRQHHHVFPSLISVELDKNLGLTAQAPTDTAGRRERQQLSTTFRPARLIRHVATQPVRQVCRQGELDSRAQRQDIWSDDLEDRSRGTADGESRVGPVGLLLQAGKDHTAASAIAQGIAVNRISNRTTTITSRAAALFA